MSAARIGGTITTLLLLYVFQVLATPLGAPPRARQFLDKRSSGGDRRPTVAQLIRANPLLASLAMFSGDVGLLQEPVDITSNSLENSVTNPYHAVNSSAAQQRSRIGRKKVAAAQMTSTNLTTQSQQLDNFDALYQLFNATLFDMAVPLEQEEMMRSTATTKGTKPRSMEQNNSSNSNITPTRMMTTSTPTISSTSTWKSVGTKPQREGRLLEQGLEANGIAEEWPAADDTTEEPFEVTESLRLALSTAPPSVPEKPKEEMLPLVGPEDFPLSELQRRAWKYPWERQRGEQQLTTSTANSLVLAPFPPVMPGASFYVDQHVSHGPFGREPESAPEVVYDPNVLQSRYGYTGMLPQVMPDGQLVRFGQPPTKSRSAHQQFGVAQHQRSAPVAPPIVPPQTVSVLPASAIFFIPAPPRLSMARAVPPPRAHGLPTAGNRTSQSPKKQLGFWPSTASWEQLETLASAGPEWKKPIATTTVKPISGKMTAMGGNALRWVPLEKAEALAKLTKPGAWQFEQFEEFGEASKFPCTADPPDLVLSDAPPGLGRPLAGCFRRVRQCVLHMARPLERRVGLGLVECARFCADQRQCQSLVHARPNSICDLFAVRNGTAGRLLHHRDFDYLEVRPFGTGSGMNLSECWRALSTTDGQGSDGKRLVDSRDDDQADNGTIITGTNSTTSSGREAPKDVCAPERDIVVFKSQGYRLADRRGHRKQRAAVVGEPPPAAAAKVLGQQSTETECIFSCLVNLARGKSPFECLAATFDQVQQRCLLYGPGSAADGSVHLVPDPSFAHYEKGCIRDSLVELCQGLPIARYPQKTLLGFALGSRQAGTLIECLEQCWAHNEAMMGNGSRAIQWDDDDAAAAVMKMMDRDGLKKCRSVVFFYEESGGHNCMLNSESRDTAPAFFVDENEALVDYASFDGCFRPDPLAIGEDIAQLEEALEGQERAVLGPRKRKEPKLLQLRPLPERRRTPSNRRFFYTKNAGQTARDVAAIMERRLHRLVDSERPAGKSMAKGRGSIYRKVPAGQQRHAGGEKAAAG